MLIDAVLLVADSGAKPARTRIDCSSIQAFAACKPGQLPAAYAVRNSNLLLLEKFKDLVFSRGKKLEAKPLSKLLLGHSKIPLLFGSYKNDGQLIRSLQTLLKNAKKDRNLYIIGAEDRVFEKLWERSQGETTFLSQAPAIVHRSKETFSNMEIARMIGEEIPVSLTERYVGASTDAQLVRQLIMRAAKTDEPVMILGDTGTGKEVVARCIHDFSDPRRERFEPVNCSAIPGELLESVLFGHEKNVFTGADSQRAGLWQEAGPGTLFLDEIADLRLDHQAKILRALQEKKIRPIGRSREVEVHARVIAATNRDLFSMMKSGQFREDLYFRLRSFLIRTSALREHPEDIPMLAQHFWKEITKGIRGNLPPKVMSELTSYGWPGNARELKAILANLFILFGKEEIRVDHLRLVFQLGGQSPSSPRSTSGHLQTHPADCFRHLKRVDEVVYACKAAIEPIVHRKTADAKLVEAGRTSLQRRLEELEFLCRHPLLFYTESTFSVVYRLKGKLAYFLNILDADLRPARSFWRKELGDEFKLTITTLFEEVQRVLPQ